MGIPLPLQHCKCTGPCSDSTWVSERNASASRKCAWICPQVVFSFEKRNSNCAAQAGVLCTKCDLPECRYNNVGVSWWPGSAGLPEHHPVPLGLLSAPQLVSNISTACLRFTFAFPIKLSAVPLLWCVWRGKNRVGTFSPIAVVSLKHPCCHQGGVFGAVTQRSSVEHSGMGGLENCALCSHPVGAPKLCFAGGLRREEIWEEE